MNTMFDGMFGRVQKGMCMLSPCGIAVKTSAGYRSYDVKTGMLRNCDNLVFGFGDSMFFVVPASKVKTGDIILNGGKPACVRKSGKDSIEVINYDTSVVETILPERHIFMGNTWFYGKIVSLFGDGSSFGGKNSVAKMMKFMMMSSLLGNADAAAGANGPAAIGMWGQTGAGRMNAGGMNTGGMNAGSMNAGGMNTGGMNAGSVNAGGIGALLPFLLLSRGGAEDPFEGLFEGLFDNDEDEADETEDN